MIGYLESGQFLDLLQQNHLELLIIWLQPKPNILEPSREHSQSNTLRLDAVEKMEVMFDASLDSCTS